MTRILAGLALTAWVILLIPFPVTTFMAACIACVSYPFYQRLELRFSKNKALGIYTGSLIAVVILPIALIVSLVAPQAVSGLRTLDRLRDSGWLQSPEAQNLFASIDTWLKKLPGLDGGLEQMAKTAADLAGSIARTVIAGGVGLAGGAFQAVLVLFLLIMITLLCVTNANLIYEFSARLTKFPLDMLERFIITIRKAIAGVLLGVVLVAMIQGILCGIGFSFAEVPQAAFWGLVAACVAPIPFIGTALVWVPVCIWLWLSGNTFGCLGIAAWSTLVVAGVDNVLRPLFLKSGIKASVIVLVLSIICGLAAFGAVGVFAGPVLIAMSIQAGHESRRSVSDSNNSNDSSRFSD